MRTEMAWMMLVAAVGLTVGGCPGDVDMECWQSYVEADVQCEHTAWECGDAATDDFEGYQCEDEYGECFADAEEAVKACAREGGCLGAYLGAMDDAVAACKDQCGCTNVCHDDSEIACYQACLADPFDDARDDLEDCAWWWDRACEDDCNDDNTECYGRAEGSLDYAACEEDRGECYAGCMN